MTVETSSSVRTRLDYPETCLTEQSQSIETLTAG